MFTAQNSISTEYSHLAICQKFETQCPPFCWRCEYRFCGTRIEQNFQRFERNIIARSDNFFFFNYGVLFIFVEFDLQEFDRIEENQPVRSVQKKIISCETLKFWWNRIFGQKWRNGFGSFEGIVIVFSKGASDWSEILRTHIQDFQA